MRVAAPAPLNSGVWYVQVKHDGGQNKHGKMRMSVGPYSKKEALVKLKELLAYHQAWHRIKRRTPPPLCLISVAKEPIDV